MDSTKDRTWNHKSIYTTLGASSHSDTERQAQDYYATDPNAIDFLLTKVSDFWKIREPACGEWHLSKRLIQKWYEVWSTDLMDRWYGEIQDFLQYNKWRDWDIITNPPYKYAKEFIEHWLSQLQDWAKLVMFLKLTFMEWKARKRLFTTTPPHTIFVSSSRIKCAINGQFDDMWSSAVAYGWYVWIKGYTGKTTVERIN